MPTLYYTPGDAALEARVSTATIRRWAERGDLPVTGRTPNGTYLFDPAEVHRLAERRRADRALVAAGPDRPQPDRAA